MTTGNYTIHKKGDYSFVCFYWETSNSWGHEVRLCLGPIEVAKARTRYYNRTWEKYAFQSCMYQAVDNYRQSELDRYIRNYLYKTYNTDCHKFARGEKKAVIEMFNKEQGSIFDMLNKAVEDGNFGKE
jgi:hypothetical protein